jgi:multiple sugar transport system permease protein
VKHRPGSPNEPAAGAGKERTASGSATSPIPGAGGEKAIGGSAPMGGSAAVGGSTGVGEGTATAASDSASAPADGAGRSAVAVVERVADPGVVAGAKGTAGAPPGSGRLARTLTGWGFALPFALLFLVFTAGPVVASLFMSVTDLRSTDLLNPFNVNFVGLDNYVKLFADEKFVTAAGVTAIFVVVGVPLTMALSLIVALGLNSGLVRFQTFFRVGYYLPVVTSIVAISVVWRFLLQPDSGLLNEFLGLFGIDGPNWLNNRAYALPTLIVMGAWRNLGFGMVIFLAGLQAIPKDLYEAATIDGAKPFQRFRFLTVPMLRPTMLFVAVITTIGYVQFFEEPFIMTRGGPLDSTLSLAYHTYNQFGFGNYGYASAMGYVLFVVVVLLSIAWFRLLRNNVDD